MVIVKSNRTALGAVLAVALSGSAIADPLSDLLQKSGGGACYTRVYDQAHLDKHPGQRATEVRVSLLPDELDGGGAIIRVMLKLGKQANYVVGGCTWAVKANLDITDQPIIEEFKGPSGLNCYALTSEDGSSAEEGGDFPIDLKTGDPILLYLPEYIAAWPSFDRSGSADFLQLGSEDRVFRLNKSNALLCRGMEEKLPWLL